MVIKWQSQYMKLHFGHHTAFHSEELCKYKILSSSPKRDLLLYHLTQTILQYHLPLSYPTFQVTTLILEI